MIICIRNRYSRDNKGVNPTASSSAIFSNLMKIDSVSNSDIVATVQVRLVVSSKPTLFYLSSCFPLFVCYILTLYFLMCFSKLHSSLLFTICAIYYVIYRQICIFLHPAKK